MNPRRIIPVALLASVTSITGVLLSTSEVRSDGFGVTYLSNAPLFEIGWAPNNRWMLIKEFNSALNRRPPGIYIEFPISPSERASLRFWTPTWSRQYYQFLTSGYSP
jgi:hypothetical protein